MPDAAVAARASDSTQSGTRQVDVAVVGAGFARLYLLHRLRKANLSAIALEEARGRRRHLVLEPVSRRALRYPDHRLQLHLQSRARPRAWTWSEKYATQPEILRYLGFVADRYDLQARYPLRQQGDQGDLGR